MILSWKKRRSCFVTVSAGLCLLLVGGLIFREFLFRDAVLLYKDIGSDSVVGYHAHFVHFSRYIHSHGFPSWSFCLGMGQDLICFAGYLIWQPVTLLPPHLIAPALVFQHIGKVVVAGLLFFRFLQLRGLQSPAPLLGALLLSFSAYMCIGSCWYSFTDEVVCYATILLGTELALQNRPWLILAFAVGIAGLINPFHLYLCALFLSLYVPSRLFAECGPKPRMILGVCFRVAAVATLGVGLGAIVTLPSLQTILSSPRGSGATPATTMLRTSPLFGLESPLHYITALLKPFANDIVGTASNFHGWQNYLEAPLTYCGLVCLLLLPHAFVYGNRRRRIIFFLFSLGVIVPIVFPWFRHVFWLFQGNYYRTFCLFCVLGIIALSMFAFSRYIEGHAAHLWFLAVTAVLLIGVLYFPARQWQTVVNPNIRSAVTLFLLLYSVLLVTGQLLRKQALAAWLIFGVSAVELVYFDRITVANRDFFRRGELGGRFGGRDETTDALDDIKATEQEKFFRIRKLQPSGSMLTFTLNDAMAFGYYGTSSYTSFNNVNYINFLTAVEAIPPNSETATRWSVGLLNEPVLSLFACEKYALVDDPQLLAGETQYHLVKRYDKGYLFRNTQFVPLGLTFDRYLTEETFLKLPPNEKAAVLLDAVVLSPESEAKLQWLTKLNLADPAQDPKDLSLADMVAARRNTALNLTSFNQTRLEGKVTLNRRSILVVQTPFDRGWHAFQDGKPAPVIKVDVGLLGVGLDAGEHKIELRYRNIFLVPGSVITFVSFLILGVGLWRWPRFCLPA